MPLLANIRTQCALYQEGFFHGDDQVPLLLFVMTQRNLIVSMEETLLVQRALCAYIRQQYPHILSDIARKGAISQETAALIPDAVRAFLAAQREAQS